MRSTAGDVKHGLSVVGRIRNKKLQVAGSTCCPRGRRWPDPAGPEPFGGARVNLSAHGLGTGGSLQFRPCASRLRPAARRLPAGRLPVLPAVAPPCCWAVAPVAPPTPEPG